MLSSQSIACMICEATTEPMKPIIQSGSSIKGVKIKTVLQSLGIMNRNKRIYDALSLLTGLQAAHIVELIKRKSWVGQAGHPMNASLEVQSNIDNDRVSHRINSWAQEGNLIIGEIESLDGGEGSPGRKFINFILQELETAFSLRALGSVQKTPEGNLVKGHIHVVTYDWVFLPSHVEAYQTEIIKMSESLTTTDNQFITEGFMIPINQTQAIQYIKDKDKNVKYISEFLEIELNNMVLSENLRSVIVKDGNITTRIRLEEQMNKNILNGYLSKL